MSYGHGGTKFQKVLVAVPPPETPPMPLWQRLLLLVVWLAIPVLVCLYALPTSTRLPTIIDISKLELKPLPEPKPVIKEPPRPKPEEKQPEPPPPLPEQVKQRPQEQPPEAPVRPQITRQTKQVQEAQDYQPRIARARVKAGSDVAVPTPGPIRRQAAQSEAPSASPKINRTRGAVAVDLPGGTERVMPYRRSAAAVGTLGGLDSGPRVVTHRSRTAGGPSGNGDVASPRVIASRGRAQTSGTDTGQGKGVSAMDMSRISLMSLQVCASPQMEEDAIKAVLSVVGDRDSCTDQKGKFYFLGTARISSFNLMITPAKGRKPTNRCEELEYAYRCLKNR